MIRLANIKSLILKNWYSLLLNCLLVLQYADSIGNSYSTASLFIYPFRNYAIIIILLIALLRTRWHIRLDEQTLHFWKKILLPFLTIITISLSLIDFFTYDNFVFQFTRHHQEQLGILTVIAWIIWIINQSDMWWKKNRSWLIALFPWILFFSLTIISTWPFDAFLRLVKEDHLIEYAQFFIFILGAIILFSQLITAKMVFQNKVILLVMIIACLFIALEEISWGQRLFRMTTPNYFLEHNLQQEITIHNLDTHHQMVGLSYLMISWLGCILAIRSENIKKNHLGKKMLGWLLPDVKVANYFVLPAIFHLARLFKNNIWRNWSEPIELLIYAGVVLWMLNIAQYLQKNDSLMPPNTPEQTT